MFSSSQELVIVPEVRDKLLDAWESMPACALASSQESRTPSWTITEPTCSSTRSLSGRSLWSSGVEVCLQPATIAGDRYHHYRSVQMLDRFVRSRRIQLGWSRSPMAKRLWPIPDICTARLPAQSDGAFCSLAHTGGGCDHETAHRARDVATFNLLRLYKNSSPRGLLRRRGCHRIDDDWRFLPLLSIVPTATPRGSSSLPGADMRVERRYDKDVAICDLTVLPRFINPRGT